MFPVAPLAAGGIAFLVTLLILNAGSVVSFLANSHWRAAQASQPIQFAGALRDPQTFHEGRPGLASAAPSLPSPATLSSEMPASTLTPRGAGDVPARDGTPATEGEMCGVQFKTEHWGDVVRWGPDNKQDSWEACCRTCDEQRRATGALLACNVWVWCGDKALCGAQYRECWLKHLAHPLASRPRAQGAGVPWTSGLMPQLAGSGEPEDDSDLRAAEGESPSQRKYHYIITAQNFATHWQARVNYYWWRALKAQCVQELGEDCQMGSYTRLLHSGEPDDLVDEIPTVVVDPIPSDVESTSYVVLNRPYAMLQWIQSVDIEEKYVLMSEPDHLLLHTLPNRMRGHRPYAFPFFYIAPSDPKYQHIAQRFVGDVSIKELEKIPPIGNAPTLLTTDQLKKVVPVWYDLALRVHRDEEANKEWGWVQEMYAFAMACYLEGFWRFDLEVDFMAQPPFDEEGHPFDILHYTFGQDYDEAGKFTPGKIGFWHWDKRDYAGRPPPKRSEPPPDGTNGLTVRLIEMVNEATGSIECWEEYRTSGKVHYKDGTGVCKLHVSSGRHSTVNERMVDPTGGKFV